MQTEEDRQAYPAAFVNPCPPPKTRYTQPEVDELLREQHERLTKPETDYDKFSELFNERISVRSHIRNLEKQIAYHKDTEAGLTSKLADLGPRIDEFVASVRRS